MRCKTGLMVEALLIFLFRRRNGHSEHGNPRQPFKWAGGGIEREPEHQVYRSSGQGVRPAGDLVLPVSAQDLTAS